MNSVAAEGAVRGPVDPGVAGRCAVSGRVVTMDAASRVLPRGTVYVDAGRIVAVAVVVEPAPAGFETVPVVRTGGRVPARRRASARPCREGRRAVGGTGAIDAPGWSGRPRSLDRR